MAVSVTVCEPLAMFTKSYLHWLLTTGIDTFGAPSITIPHEVTPGCTSAYKCGAATA
jgi:hypothetical protein